MPRSTINLFPLFLTFQLIAVLFPESLYLLEDFQ